MENASLLFGTAFGTTFSALHIDDGYFAKSLLTALSIGIDATALANALLFLHGDLLHLVLRVGVQDMGIGAASGMASVDVAMRAEIRGKRELGQPLSAVFDSYHISMRGRRVKRVSPVDIRNGVVIVVDARTIARLLVKVLIVAARAKGRMSVLKMLSGDTVERQLHSGFNRHLRSRRSTLKNLLRAGLCVTRSGALLLAQYVIRLRDRSGLSSTLLCDLCVCALFLAVVADLVPTLRRLLLSCTMSLSGLLVAGLRSTMRLLLGGGLRLLDAGSLRRSLRSVDDNEIMSTFEAKSKGRQVTDNDSPGLAVGDLDHHSCSIGGPGSSGVLADDKLSKLVEVCGALSSLHCEVVISDIWVITSDKLINRFEIQFYFTR